VTSRNNRKNKPRNVEATPLDERIEALSSTLPFYVQEYITYQLEDKYRSERTVYSYIHDFVQFFNWLIEQKETDVANIKDIPLSCLEQLSRDTVNAFLKASSFEIVKNKKDKAKTRKAPVDQINTIKPNQNTKNRKISALKSLFRYLTEITEYKVGEFKGESYFHRNVMKKIEISKAKNAAEAASAISSKIFHEDQDKQFLEFVVSKYENQIADNKKMLTHFLKNKERDIAILTLFLGSALRVSELASLTLDDVDLVERQVYVVRKGHTHKQAVKITQSALDDLKQYINIRKERYKLPSDEIALFVTGNKKGDSPYSVLSVRAIQNLVAKYTASFGKKMSPHKLRHTFASRLSRENNGNIKVVQNQLGHTSSQTSLIYVHLNDKEQEKAVDKSGI